VNRIRLLHEQVANQIAAGEVVERPASVVKELVENALDASPSRIIVEIQAGGRSLIRVTDDGIGMSRDDALLSLERHATSKIRLAEDLSSIATMGFRGEALPSIASVSRFSLTTRERDAGDEGTQVLVSGGRIVEVKSAGLAPGTSVEVRQLFFNLPARRKFLRSEETERAHILHYLTLAALAFPEVGFTVLQDGSTLWQFPPTNLDHYSSMARRDAVETRLRTLLGSSVILLRVDFSRDGLTPRHAGPGLDEVAPEDTSSPIRVWGFIGAPGVSRATRQDQHIFVNRRPVENRALNFALMEGYHTALMKGQYPVCCLFLEIDPAEVDVNIHPAKREVRFVHERAVRNTVAEAVRQTLLDFHRQASAGNTREHAVRPAADPVANSPGIPQRVAASLATADQHRDTRQDPVPAARVAAAEPGLFTSYPKVSDPLPIWTSPTSAVETAPSAPSPAVARALTDSPSAPAPLLAVPLRLIGVVGKLYVLLESDQGLVLMDQHAAHERVLFEQMLQRLEQGSAPSQRLLLPQTVELSPRDVAFVREHLAVLVRLGVGLSEFGERTFMLDALPPFVKAPDARRFVLKLIDELLAAGQKVNSLRLGEQMVAKTVCRHAVKANDSLSNLELEALIKDLRNCAMPYTCPHGRPTLIEMHYRELEKKFGRVT
jgi:DNA mismatch repair protein MutL